MKNYKKKLFIENTKRIKKYAQNRYHSAYGKVKIRKKAKTSSKLIQKTFRRTQKN